MSIYDIFVEKTRNKFSEYPSQRGKFRCFVDLYGPYDFLADVQVDHKAHYPYYNYYYCCDDWSTIFDIESYSMDEIQHYCCCLESNNVSPIYGERVILFSTSTSIWDEPWGKNKANTFAFFRNRIYGVNPIVFEGRWKGGLSYPLVDTLLKQNKIKYWSHPDNYIPNDFLKPSLFFESENKKYYGFYQSIIENVMDEFNWRVLCDFLVDNEQESFANYILSCVNKINFYNNDNILFVKKSPKKLRYQIFNDRIFKIWCVEELNRLYNILNKNDHYVKRNELLLSSRMY